jgi:putative tricarboxylic transport membrane protein
MRRATTDLLAGLAFIGFGLAFSVGATAYEIGTALRMGPGYFPLVLGGLLVLLGILIIAKGFIAGEGADLGRVAWRAAALIVGALLFFGATIRGLGVGPSVFLTALLAGFSGHRTGAVAPVVIAVALTVTCVVIFIVALQLPLRLLGPWIPV